MATVTNNNSIASRWNSKHLSTVVAVAMFFFIIIEFAIIKFLMEAVSGKKYAMCSSVWTETTEEQQKKMNTLYVEN